MLEIVKIPIKQITMYENNAKLHTKEQIEHIVNSIKQFGFNDPIAVWGPDNIIIEGHGRFKAVKKLKYTEVECIRLDGLTDEQRIAYTLAHNHIASETGLDIDLMRLEMSKVPGIDLGALGFEILNVETPETFSDPKESGLAEIMESEECIVSRGDVWQMGRHRLMCGDATKREEMAYLLDGETADLVITDPPYNMNFTGVVTSVPKEPGGEWGRTETRALENDNMNEFDFREFLARFYANVREFLAEGKNAYIFHSYHAVDDFVRCCKESGLAYEQNLVWVKPSFTLSGSLYQHRHELCLLARNGGMAGDRTWNSGRSDSDVIEYPNIDDMTEEELRNALRDVLANKVALDAMERDRNTEEVLHSTMKPVPLIMELMRNSSNINELVVDFFGGSGTTLIAAEQCSRVCYCNELDEIYCTRTIRRWEKLTGKKAAKVGNYNER